MISIFFCSPACLLWFLFTCYYLISLLKYPKLFGSVRDGGTDGMLSPGLITIYLRARIDTGIWVHTHLKLGFSIH
jgi:hypothetical protein